MELILVRSSLNLNEKRPEVLERSVSERADRGLPRKKGECS